MTSRDISEKYISQNAMNLKLEQQVVGEKKIRMSMLQQVLDDAIMTSREICENYTSQNGMNLKLGQQVVGEKKIRLSMFQQVLDDVIMIFSEKHTS